MTDSLDKPITRWRYAIPAGCALGVLSACLFIASAWRGGSVAAAEPRIDADAPAATGVVLDRPSPVWPIGPATIPSVGRPPAVETPAAVATTKFGTTGDKREDARKRIWVEPYTRSDGTVVRGHFRDSRQ